MELVRSSHLFPVPPSRASHLVLPERGEAAEITDIMERLAAGERSALDDLLQIYWGPVVGYISRAFNDVEGAQDIAQETFWRAWELRGQWRGGSARAYLFRMARNLSVDELRRRRARERAELKSEVIEGRPPPTPDDVYGQAELIAQVDSAIQSLPPRRREVLTLVYLQGLTYREAAEVMDISVKTVGNQITAAVAELRRVMDHARPPKDT
jgi:RNA polymerase sigma-70 factor, ECF subfamily